MQHENEEQSITIVALNVTLRLERVQSIEIVNDFTQKDFSYFKRQLVIQSLGKEEVCRCFGDVINFSKPLVWYDN